MTITVDETALDETALVHAKFASGQIELGQIAVVMGYHHDRLARPLQLRQ